MSVAIDKAIIFSNRTAPAETPTSGEAYFWMEGDSLKYKANDNIVRTLSTGITAEEVQDIVGTMLTSSASVTVSYDDVNNILTMAVVQSAISHANIGGVGTNTHGQIDSHIASTANPHSTTKSQVGLGNVDNTSDLNKPISTATQLALNAKYDATNPNGYETPAQLNSRDSANRSRANHTGTQLAATISDFNTAADARVAAGIGTHESALDPHPQYLTAAEGNAAYATAGHTHADATTSVSGFMSGADKTKLDGITNDIIYKNTTTLTNSSNVTLTNITECGFPVVAGNVYKFRTWILFQASNTNTGISIAMLNSGAAGTLSAMLRNNTSTTAASLSTLNAFNTVLTFSATPSTANKHICEIEGFFDCTTSGTIIPQFRSETNGNTITVHPNSITEVKQL